VKRLGVKTALPVVIRLHVVKRRVLNVMQGFTRTKCNKFYLLTVKNVLLQVFTVLREHPLKSSAPLVHFQINRKRLNARYVKKVNTNLNWVKMFALVVPLECFSLTKVRRL
jgi:hypothetical protein